MKYLQELPWVLVLDDNRLDAVLYAVYGGEYKCDLEGDGSCHPAPFAIGTSDTHEPKFCFKHYFEGCAGNGFTDYEVVPKQSS